MKLDDARRFALSLPEVTEAPHFHYSSFRVRGKIFATVPPEGSHMHIFVAEPERGIVISARPQAYEKLWWGKKVAGLRVTLARAKTPEVEDLLYSAWDRRAPKKIPRPRR